MSRSRKRIADMALAAIKAELEENERLGRHTDAVFITSELRYIIAAYPNDALTHVLGKGDFIYGVPLVRYLSDDVTKFFVAKACPVDCCGDEDLMRHWQTPLEAAGV